MIAGRTAIVHWYKRDRYARLVGQVFLDGRDAGIVQIERGMAWHYKAYEREQRPEDARAYAHAELNAKAARRGLWADPRPLSQWEWRKEKAAK